MHLEQRAPGTGTGWVAGLDGCPAGWIAVLSPLEAPFDPLVAMEPVIGVHADFAAFVAAFPDLAAIAVDMPIGLPERIGGPGRPAEQAVRPLLGARQSSVFSIPVRAAVEAPDYGAACRAALAGSDPPRKVSKQGFHLFPRIREIDAALRSDPALVPRVVETHPEFVFRRLAGAPLTFPKKRAEGVAERRSLLAAAGLPASLLEARPPAGAATDDLLDAAACLLTAFRHARGEARPHPDPFPRDRHGLPIAIWC